MTSPVTITLKSIGFVKTEAVGDEVKDKTRTSQIVISPDLSEALDGIEEFSHIYVLFWLNEVTAEDRKRLKIHPRGRTDLPLTGVFATRTNLRPNPIGLTLVKLLSRERNVLTVEGLDAYNGTPVLDVKPYDFWDVNPNIRVPDWWLKLHEEKKQKK